MTGIGRFTSQKAEEIWGGPPELPTTTWSAAGLMLAHVALGVIFIPLALASAIAMSGDMILEGRVGLQLEIG